MPGPAKDTSATLRQAVGPASASADEVEAWERDHVLHPWVAQPPASTPIVVRARGTRFWEADGSSYLDFTSQLVFANLGHSDHQNRHSQKAHRNLLRNQNSISTRATRVFVLRIVTVQPRKTKITQLAFVAWGRPIAGRPPFATDPVGRILKVIVDRWASLCNFGTKCEGLCNA